MIRRRKITILSFQIMFILFALPILLLYFAYRQTTPLIVNTYLIAGVGFLGCALLLETVAHEKIPVRKTNFSQQKCASAMITPQARKLSEALTRKGIKNKLEDYDGYKHVDISIPWAKLNIEIDGSHHLLNSEQLFSDLERDYFSYNHGKSTIRIPNDFVDFNVEELADSIAKVARERYYRNFQNSRTYRKTRRIY